QKNIADLEAKGDKERANRARELHEEELRQLFVEEIESSSRYKKVMEEIDKSSQFLLASAFKTGKQAVMALVDGMQDATPAQKATLKKLFGEWFDQGEREASIGNFEGINNLVAGFDQLVNLAGQFDDSMSNTLKTIGGMVSEIGSLSSSIGKMLGTTGQTLSSAGAIGGIIGTMFSLFGSIVQFGEAKADK